MRGARRSKAMIDRGVSKIISTEGRTVIYLYMVYARVKHTRRMLRVLFSNIWTHLIAVACSYSPSKRSWSHPSRPPRNIRRARHESSGDGAHTFETHPGNRRIPSRVAENDRIPSRRRSNYVRIPSRGWINYAQIPSRLVLDGINISSIFIELQEASPDITRIVFLYYRNYSQ
jgi:hypothetical protein